MTAEAVHQAIDEVFSDLEGLDVLLSGLSDAEILDGVEKLALAQSRLTTAQAKLLGAYDGRDLHELDQAKSPSVAIAHRTGQPLTRCRKRIKQARKLTRCFPRLAVALAKGEMNWDQAELWFDMADDVFLCDLLQEHEEALLACVWDSTLRLMKEQLAQWRGLVAPEQEDELVDRRLNKVGARRYQDYEGNAHLEQVLDPVRAALQNSVIDVVRERLFAQDWAEAAEKYGEAHAGSNLRRTNEERLAEAVHLLIMAGAGSGDAFTFGPPVRALVKVLVDDQTLVDETARQLGISRPDRSITDLKKRVCSLENGTSIAPSEAYQLAVLGQVMRIVLDGKNILTNVGKPKRFFKGALREAILARDRNIGCDVPSCIEPLSRCEIDHVEEFSRGGPTEHWNGSPKCKRHNLAKQNGRFRSIRDAGGRVRTYRLDGSEIT